MIDTLDFNVRNNLQLAPQTIQSDYEEYDRYEKSTDGSSRFGHITIVVINANKNTFYELINESRKL